MEVDDAKTAAKVAVAFVSEVFADDNVWGVALEEIEREGNSWLITVGYQRRGESTVIAPMLENLNLPAPAGPRHYKVVHVDRTGEVTAMKNRE